MTIDWAALRAAAADAAMRAYAPYSRLRVGAAGLTGEGRIVTGCNVENASFGLTLCAECGLVSALHATAPQTPATPAAPQAPATPAAPGAPQVPDEAAPEASAAASPALIAVAVVAGDGDPLLPCGRCRQLLLEAGGPSLLVDTLRGPRPLAELLPAAFGGEDLDARREPSREPRPTAASGPSAPAGPPPSPAAGPPPSPAAGPPPSTVAPSAPAGPPPSTVAPSAPAGPSPGPAAAQPPAGPSPGPAAPAGRGADRGGATLPDAVSLIRVKRDNERPLTEREISWLFAAYGNGEVTDEQMAALLMAIYFSGLDDAELRAWTAEMIASGERLDLSGLGKPSVDKHSTGGVGDKVSLVLAPLVASCGAVVPQLSGRGLGHTGGTLDKLESVPGWRASLGNEELVSVLKKTGVVIAAAGAGLAPADRRLYALRDVTGTVESIPLIASSIMSKKIAEGTGALVLDVKTGSGAFMRDPRQARALARTMVALGNQHKVRTRALVTRMDTPLGRAVGNALEVAEAIAALSGEGPDDLMEVTYALARNMLELAGIDADPEEAIASGRALDTFRAMIKAQGGDPDAPLPEAGHRQLALTAPESGWITGLDALAVGIAAWRLGAGRARRDDDVSRTAGVRCLAKPGEYVRKGQPVVELHADDPARFGPAIDALRGSLSIGSEPPPTAPLVIDEVGA
jgi:thymidine phosphorylase